jgi:hypothetical protein
VAASLIKIMYVLTCGVMCCLQVAARLAAAGHNRSLWPPAARKEVAELEQQLEFMQVDGGPALGTWGCAAADNSPGFLV